MLQRSRSQGVGESVDYRRNDGDSVAPQQDSQGNCQAVGCEDTARTLLTIKWRGGQIEQKICGGHEIPLSHLRRVVRGDVVVWETAL